MQRYDLVFDTRPNHPEAFMEANSNGDYVEYSDIEAELTRLRAIEAAAREYFNALDKHGYHEQVQAKTFLRTLLEAKP